MEILKPKLIVTVRVDYFMPDYSHLLNEFYWQTNDYWPEIPRIHRFLNFWHDNIEAVINQVMVQKTTGNWRHIGDDI